MAAAIIMVATTEIAALAGAEVELQQQLQLLIPQLLLQMELPRVRLAFKAW
ncbi:hypothetical protein D3C76_1881140 [compost metagenome]